MVLWQWINDNLPPYAEQITINEEGEKTADLKNERDGLIQDKKELEQEVGQIKETLSQFKHLAPDKFIELKQLNWMCSTQGWKEPLCERYNCLINGEWKQVDISHALLEKLELTKNIPYPIYISPTVLGEGLDNYFAYNVKEKKEIFLKKPFTVENLEEDIAGYYKKIKELERWTDQFPGQTPEQVKKELDDEKGWWDKWISSKINFGHTNGFLLLDPFLNPSGTKGEWFFFANYDFFSTKNTEENIRLKLFLKEHIYQYYRDK